jgi:hypothetical protein
MENLGKVVSIIIVSILLSNKKCSTIYSMHFETTRAYLQKVVVLCIKPEKNPNMVVHVWSFLNKGSPCKVRFSLSVFSPYHLCGSMSVEWHGDNPIPVLGTHQVL